MSPPCPETFALRETYAFPPVNDEEVSYSFLESFYEKSSEWLDSEVPFPGEAIPSV